MSSATVYFSNKEDLLGSSRFTTYYHNNKLRWAAINKGNFTDKPNQSIQEVLRDEIQKRSFKSLGKMKEVEQDLIRESSKLAQRRVWNRVEETKAYETSLEDEI